MPSLLKWGHFSNTEMHVLFQQ